MADKPVFGPFAILAWRADSAREDSTCPACGKGIRRREAIIRDDRDQGVHPDCARRLKDHRG